MRALLLLCLAACSRPPNECASAPSYERVAPIIQNRCLTCHAPGGAAEDHDFSKPAALRVRAPSVRARVASRAMPPPGAPPLTDDEAAIVLRWIACGP